MLCLRGLRRIKAAAFLQRNSAHRSLSSAEALQDEPVGELLKAEGPSKEPQRGCVLCSVTVDFKNIQLLSQFISPHTGRIYGRHITGEPPPPPLLASSDGRSHSVSLCPSGLCGQKQREVSKAIKKAHSLGFMPVTHKHPQFMKDPRICGIKHVD
ncbi:PREDICTED: 28S ribosomal protein S18c, mitochondrial isoform X1 [Cyprinodon variegatus]|uniref:28S ribosomal protein S18c, mitochondrial isoform X1 n=1 Tax=Cyprinodon variegatus TaxID=28743 RepID=UPI000742BC0F|nr:PREDICTED: 28S ribosomal protein S18c, mitochondrial isoform X1 [Cyprinodon variegatus]